jgi:hypothetical protein
MENTSFNDRNILQLKFDVKQAIGFNPGTE